MGPTPDAQDQPSDDLGAYVGLDADDAGNRARRRGWTTVRSVPPGAIITMEYVVGRINFEVAHGRVVRCWRG
ncbi:I78 family peptidase inhibitor [Streptomyces liangshanensis]|uniref:Proteinase inhibitor I78 n=1 Tax=Streptomyces liangshanensis TaxID=2717324 RepID=A0A6G9H4M1_9ACTN|nr:I78 family peptidase inhibitor [Streptomyces liangshanensis]QIQ05483.1 proteinase inhibitor I78 [Streptomyces liangshanensis]